MIEQNKASSKISTDTTSARRSFLKKAAISAPILTTIAARPVWAGQCSLSGNLSNNVSNHDHSVDCALNIYSPGGFLCGSASNLWSYTGLTRTSPLTSLLGTLLPDVTPAHITIEAALSGNGKQTKNGNGGGNGGGIICSDVTLGEYSATGWERQLAAAALNALLWQEALLLCEGNLNCNIMDDLADNFYFPFTLQEIRVMYFNGPPGIYDWDAIQNID